MDTKEKSKKNVTDVQKNAFQVTINNPQNYGLDHLSIKKILIEKFTTLRYICMADEIGANGTPHTHVYVCFNSRVRFSTLKKHFPQAHIEAAFGNSQSNRDYVQKSGKWKDTEKAETSVAGTFEEWGTIPTQKGKRVEMEELYNMLEAGLSNSEILAQNNDYILHLDKLDKVRATLLMEKYKGIRRTDLEVIYICGKTGVGKTKNILDKYGDINVYRVTDYQHPFDSYQCQPVLVFEEFRNSLKISDMLNYCDIYPLELPARYTNRYACYNMVFIVSNWILEDQYKDVQKSSPDTWKAFLRRIKKIHVYKEYGSVTTYDSVDQYLHREESFQKLSTTDDCPFA